MVWKGYAALKERLARHKPLLEALARGPSKKRIALLNQASESELRILRDLRQGRIVKRTQ